MELLTQEIRDKFKKIGSQAKKKLDEQIVVVKFFDPTGSWTWYATEFDGKDVFYGLVDGFELEWGPFRRSELKSIRGAIGLGIESDLYFGMPRIKDINRIKDRVL